ncbi:MAG: trigger factor [Deltaproteobacteria bacterium]|nr:trigger factor [Deltaproteobacteria bacterium]
MATTNLENLSAVKKKITITVKKDDVNNYVNKAMDKVRKSAKINGFRPGKIPNNVLEKHYGPQIDYECLNTLISETFTKALIEHKLTPMTEPDFDTKPLDREKDYEFTAQFEVKPEVELKEYKGIKLKKQEAKVSDKELNDELERLRENLAQLAPVEEGAKVKKGLVATIDFEGKLDGVAFEGGSAKDYVFEYGNGQLLKDFEDAMKGLAIGDSKEFKMTFPKDYFEKSLAGKEADYKITVKNLHVKNLPELDDEMAKDIGKESLNEVKEELKKSLVRRKEDEFRRDYAEEIKAALLKAHSKIEVPESIVKQEVERSKKEEAEVIKDLQIELILEAISQKENISVTQEEVNQRIAVLAQMYRQPAEEIRKVYQKNNMLGSLAAQIVLDKTLDFVIDNAKMA